jgi:hypothetical protein
MYTDDYNCQEFGQGFAGVCDGAVPLINTRKLSNSPHFGITQTGLVGSNGNAPVGPGVNFFGSSSNITQIFNSFRPVFPGIDGRSMTTGNLRGGSRYNLDLGITKDTKVTERVGVQFYMQAFNVTNHMEWADPCWGSPCYSIVDPADFGTLTGQFNALGLAGGTAGQNYTRVMQLGLRVSF